MLGICIEIGNEPRTHKSINTAALRSVLEQSGFPYCSGDYEDSAFWFGSYYVCHTARTRDWPRRAHDLLEFYEGKGPDKKTHPHHVACIGDEPGKLEDVGTDPLEWRAYFGGCALMGAGATFHSETGKFGQRPTADSYDAGGRLVLGEKTLAAVALDALNAFPPEAPRGPYRRIVEPGNELGGPTVNSRTYVMGAYMVRSQQVGLDATESGWTALDNDGILFTR